MQKHNTKQLATPPDVLTIWQVQDILGIGRIGVYKLIETGSLNVFRIGHAYKIPKSSLVTYQNTKKGDSV